MISFSQMTSSNAFSWLKKCVFLSTDTSLKIVPKGPNDNELVLVQVIDWCQTDDCKPLPEPVCSCINKLSQIPSSTARCSDTTRALSLQWRHNGRHGVWNHQPHDCLLNRLFRRRSKKTPKLRVTGLCVGNSLVIGEFPAQMASNAENIFIGCGHHDWVKNRRQFDDLFELTIKWRYSSTQWRHDIQDENVLFVCKFLTLYDGRH